MAWVALAATAAASPLNPVAWKGPAEPLAAVPGGTVTLRLGATIEAGYHLYSLTTPPGGPIRTRIRVNAGRGIHIDAIYEPKPATHIDPRFHIPIETYSDGCDFLIRLALDRSVAEGQHPVEVIVRYQACNNEICLAPVERTIAATVVAHAGVAPIPSVPAGYLRADVAP